MILRKLKLRNFRNFIDCTLEFSTDPKKNFTIILGQNTYGKTTLVKSFIWGLYRENLFDDKTLLNKDVANTLVPGGKSQEVKVEIELEHKGFSYKIVTKESYGVTTSGSIFVKEAARTSLLKTDDDGSTPMEDSLAAEEINNILRKELKEYFFFDGETNSIESISSKKNLTEAVTNILGLNSVEKIKDYFDPSKNESVPGYLRNEIIKVDDDAISNINDVIDGLNEQLQKAEGRLTTASEEIERLQDQEKDLNEQIDANKDVASDQEEKKRLDRSLQEEIESKDKNFNSLIQSINTSNALLKIEFANCFLKYDLENVLSSSSFKSKNSLKHISDKAVDMLIERGYCICGAKITNGNDAYKHLMESKQHMEPSDFGKYASDFISAEKNNIYTGNTILDNITTSADNLLNLFEKIDDDVRALKSVKKRIEGRTDVGEIQKQLNSVEQQLATQKAIMKIASEDTIPNLKDQLKKANDKLLTGSDKTEYNEFIKLCLAYVEDIHTRASNTIKKSRTEIKASLEKEVGNIFASMYHGNRIIKIDDNFKAYTESTSKGKASKLDGSTGLGTVVNYSFVAGLMKLAKNKIVEKVDKELEDTETSGESYPLIMDAPFSNTDEDHIKNICTSLPNFCDQIIMFVMKKDFNYASESIKDKIGKQYVIVKSSETDADVKEAK